MELWKQDACLASLDGRFGDYDLFSFDLFDTLLFRRCPRPVDVFAMVWEKALGRFPNQAMTAEDYLEFRRAAEQSANRKHAPRHDYEYIFKEMPLDKALIDFLREEEIETEKRVVYLNKAMVSLLYTLREKGKSAVIVSNMYHSAAVLRDILSTAGFDFGLVSNLFVSSEYAKYKSTGLFKVVLDSFPDIKPDRVLHIGDSEYEDYHSAQTADLNSILYCR